MALSGNVALAPFLPELSLLHGQLAALLFIGREPVTDPEVEAHDFRRVRIDLATIAQIIPRPADAEGRPGDVDVTVPSSSR